MYNEIYERIKEFNTIVICRHVGVDPDALCSQLALRDSILATFPEKKVLAVGSGSSKYTNIGKLDKSEDVSDALLIVTDTPDKRRVDCSLDFSLFKYMIKIDHHPFIEKFCDLELIEDDKTSACEIIMNMLKEVPLVCNKGIAELLFMGLVSDSNRFLFNSSTDKTFKLVGDYIKEYNLDINSLYQKLYARPLNEVRLEGYIALNMTVTENGLAYIKITDQIINEFGVDSAAAGNMVNNFNFINGVIVWATLTEDVKNNQIRVSIRSRGPIVNKVAESFKGGGHKYASGAKPETFEEAMKLMEVLDQLCMEYNGTEVLEDGD